MKVYSTNLTFSEIRNLGCPISTLIMNGSILPNDSGKRLVLVGENADYNGTSFKTLLAFGGAVIIPSVFFHPLDDGHAYYGIRNPYNDHEREGEQYFSYVGDGELNLFRMGENGLQLIRYSALYAQTEVSRDDFYNEQGKVFIMETAEHVEIDTENCVEVSLSRFKTFLNAEAMGAYGYAYHSCEMTDEVKGFALAFIQNNTDLGDAEDFLLYPKVYKIECDYVDFFFCVRSNGKYYIVNCYE